jgi:hypothetical protein
MHAVASLALVALIAACSAATPASPSPAPSQPANPSPSALPPASPSAPSPTPQPTPTPVPTWSAAQPVDGLQGCFSVVVAIDETGTSHLAANCGDGGEEIRYAVSPDGHAWTTTTFAPPKDRLEQDPQLAFDGSTLYLAYSRVALTEGGCGDDGLTDLGVYVRSRALPDGAWSDPERVGSVADQLQAFRASGGTLHLTVSNEKDGKSYYEALTRGVIARHAIAGAAGGIALRIGDDGKARLAFEAASGIRFGSFDGTKLVAETIPGSTGGWDPVFILAPGNVAAVVWNRSYHGLGCAEPGPQPEDGTYFATNASGTWKTSKLADTVGGASLALDATTGEIQALLGDFKHLDLYTLSGSQVAAKKSLATGFLSSAVIRQNPVTGALVVAYVRDDPDEPTRSQVEVLIRS